MLHHILHSVGHGCVTYVLGMLLTILLSDLLGQVYIHPHAHPLPKGRLTDHSHRPLKSTKATNCTSSQKPFACKNTENTGLNRLPWPPQIYTSPIEHWRSIFTHCHTFRQICIHISQVINTHRLPLAKACQSGVHKPTASFITWLQNVQEDLATADAASVFPPTPSK